MMERLGDDEIFSIFERIPNREDKKSFSIVCKRFFKVACFQLRSLNNQLPDLLYDILTISPKMVLFVCHKTLTNNHMKLIAKSCPNIKDLDLSSWPYLDHDHEVGKLEFDDVGLCAIAHACIHLECLYLSGRLRFKEIGIGSLVISCKNLKVLNLNRCLNVTDKSMKVIGETTRIRQLYLEGCYLISDLGLEYLANGDLKYCLEGLFLNKCDRITDNGIFHLKKLVSLRRLDLNNCGANITDFGVVALCELPVIRILSLDSLFNLTDISLHEIACKCLKVWWISLEGCNRITSAGLRAFSGHRHLTRLGLFSCYNISWEDVRSIALTCPDLKYLQLSRSIKNWPMPKAGSEDFYIEMECKETSSPSISFQIQEELRRRDI